MTNRPHRLLLRTTFGIVLAAAPCAAQQPVADPASTAVAPTPSPAPELTMDQAADEAVRLLEADELDLPTRIEGVKRILGQFPDSADSWAALGELLMREGSDDKAVNAFKQAVAHDPSLHSPWHWIGIVEKRRGNLEAAIGAFDAAIRAGGPKSTELNEKAVALAKSQRMEEAYAAWREAIAADPDWGVLHSNAVKACLALRDEEGAREHFEKGLAAGRFEDTTALIWTEWLVKGKRTKEALAAYGQALDKQPKAYRVRYSYAMALKDEGKTKDAIPELQRALADAYAANDRNLTTAIEKSLFATQFPGKMKDLVRAEQIINDQVDAGDVDEGKLRKAVGLMDPIIADNPRLWEPRLMRGVAHRRLGDSAAAVADFEAVLREAPDQPNAILNIGLVQRDRGEMEEALKSVKRAAEIAPEDPLVAANAAIVMLDAGDCGAARETLDRAGDAIPPAHAVELRARIAQSCP